MKKLYSVLAVLLAVSFALTACGPAAAPAPAMTEAPATQAPAMTEAPAMAKDLLSEIQSRGYVIVSSDPNYEPQSFLNTQGSRPSDTKCPSDTLTTAEMQGFDVDVAHKIGDALGVETCFATPDWDVITAGNWADKWDISVGSMTITPERQKVLDFSVPYYYTPAVVAVASDSGVTSLDQLAGQALCVGASTTYEDWLNGKLDLPASSIYAQPPANVQVVSLSTDQECAQSIQAGRKDFVGYVTSETVVDSNIANGLAVTKVGKAVFSEDLAAAVDKNSSYDTASFLAKVDDTITGMHNDGTLTALSNQWFQTDLTQAPNQ